MNTIHLSRLILNASSRQVQNELAAPYEMHKTLSHAFPNLSKEEWAAARVLFRVDDEHGVLSLLVQSKHQPDWAAFASHLNGRYLLGSPQVKAWSPKFEVGQALRFRLQANPTFAQKIEGQTNKRGHDKNVRRGLYREAERLDWLRRQSVTHGFELSLVPTTLRAKGEKQFIFRGREYDELSLELPMSEVLDLNDGKRFPVPTVNNQFSAARFDGVLRVTDAEAFTNAVENGIGKARGYGFGLLSVAPASK